MARARSGMTSAAWHASSTTLGTRACPRTRHPSGLWRLEPAPAGSIPPQRPRAEFGPRHCPDLRHAKAQALVERQVGLVH
jgi:hypothetical protein